MTYAQQHRDRFVDELKTLLRLPSVSTLPQHREDVQRTAEWLVPHLREPGMTAELIPLEGGHPIVYAQWMQAPGRPTVLFYGHYDVQPVGPTSEWKSPPFEPTVRGDDLYARGASDDKGQGFGVVQALESFLRDEGGRRPLQAWALFAGGEECGSPGIRR